MLLNLKYILKTYVFGTGIVSLEKDPKVNAVIGTQQLLPAKEDDGASKKTKPPEDNKFGHEQVNEIKITSFPYRNLSNSSRVKPR